MSLQVFQKSLREMLPASVWYEELLHNKTLDDFLYNQKLVLAYLRNIQVERLTSINGPAPQIVERNDRVTQLKYFIEQIEFRPRSEQDIINRDIVHTINYHNIHGKQNAVVANNPDIELCLFNTYVFSAMNSIRLTHTPPVSDIGEIVNYIPQYQNLLYLFLLQVKEANKILKGPPPENTMIITAPPVVEPPVPSINTSQYTMGINTSGFVGNTQVNEPVPVNEPSNSWFKNRPRLGPAPINPFKIEEKKVQTLAPPPQFISRPIRPERVMTYYEFNNNPDEVLDENLTLVHRIPGQRVHRVYGPDGSVQYIYKDFDKI